MTPGERPLVALVGVDEQENGQAALAFATDFVGRDGRVATVTATGPDPARTIVESAVREGADLIAVGTHHGAPRLLRAVGSVTHKVLRLADVPVAVVRAPWSAPSDDAPILVGIGSGGPTRAAIDWSVHVARRDGRSLTLVRSVDVHPMAGLADPIDVMASYIDPGRLTEWAVDELARLAAELGPSGVVVTTSVRSGAPGARLVEAANEGAAFLVIGKHFDGAVTGYFTGRTLHHALTHADCPVIVVPQQVAPGS